MWSAIKKETVRDMKKKQDSDDRLGVTSNRRGRFKSLDMMVKPSVPPLVGNPDSSIRNTLRSFLGMLTTKICKRMRDYFPSKQNIYSK